MIKYICSNCRKDFTDENIDFVVEDVNRTKATIKYICRECESTSFEIEMVQNLYLN